MIKRWRESLPARVAMATAGLLTIIFLTVTAASYVITARLLRQAVDSTLKSALTAVAGPGRDDPEREAQRFEEEHHDPRRFQFLDPEGRVRGGTANLPVDPQALASIAQRGQAIVSMVQTEDGTWMRRSGPDWWQALTPAENELRVLYAVPHRGADGIVEVATPLEAAHEVLPSLLRWLILLGIAGVVLASAIAWRMARETYKPLQAVITTAADIRAHSLALRIPDVWHDSTLRKLTGVLNEMIARLQGAFEAQGRFVAAAAHELRGPLAAMRAELEVTLRRQRTPEEYRAALEGALTDTVRLSTLSEHLLMLARYERGAGLVMERDVALAPLIERTATEVRRATGGEIAVSVPPDLHLDGDPLALERVISNLARNGVQYGEPPVVITARALDGGVEITVADHGPGISPEAQPQLFDPFYRADPARGRDGGTGLGLAIVKTVVEAHNGRVTVESAPGQGAAFHVWLPQHQDSGSVS